MHKYTHTNMHRTIRLYVYTINTPIFLHIITTKTIHNQEHTPIIMHGTTRIQHAIKFSMFCAIQNKFQIPCTKKNQESYTEKKHIKNRTRTTNNIYAKKIQQ